MNFLLALLGVLGEVNLEGSRHFNDEFEESRLIVWGKENGEEKNKRRINKKRRALKQERGA